MDSSRIHNTTIDALRVLSILAVLLIHTTTRHLEIVNFVLPRHQFTLFLNQASRFAVPLFFLISGYVLELNYRPGLLDYYKKRLTRLFLPYLFWSAIYYFFIYTDHHSLSFWSTLLTGNSSYQLYFIPSLLLLYLLYPLLRRFSNLPFMIILFLLQLYILQLDYQLRFPAIPYPFSVVVFNLFPFLFGIYQSHHTFHLSRLWCYFFLLPLAYCLYFIFQEGFSGYLHTWNIHYFYSQWRPSVLIYSLLIFIVSYRLLPTSLPYIHTLSHLSFFVFFIHIIVLEQVWKYLGVFIYQYPGFDLFYFSIIVSISFLLAYFVHKIPYLSRLTG